MLCRSEPRRYSKSDDPSPARQFAAALLDELFAAGVVLVTSALLSLFCTGVRDAEWAFVALSLLFVVSAFQLWVSYYPEVLARRPASFGQRRVALVIAQADGMPAGWAALRRRWLVRHAPSWVAALCLPVMLLAAGLVPKNSRGVIEQGGIQTLQTVAGFLGAVYVAAALSSLVHGWWAARFGPTGLRLFHIHPAPRGHGFEPVLQTGSAARDAT